jgi:hypothetical protein
LRGLLNRFPANQQPQGKNQLQLMTPAAKTQPGLAHHQPRQIPFAHREFGRPLPQRLPAGRINRHQIRHLTNLRMRGNRQLQMFLRLPRELIEQHLYQPLRCRMGKRLAVTSGEGQDKLANEGEIFKVQQCAGIGAASGSINKKLICAPGVARLLCGI